MKIARVVECQYSDLLKSYSGKWFGERVGQVLLDAHLIDVDWPILDEIADSVIGDINMSRLRLAAWIVG